MNITSIATFICSLIIIIFEIVDAFEQNIKLNLTNEELAPFSELNIEGYLEEVFVRAKYLKIYTISLFFIIIIHILITILIYINIKYEKKYSLIENEQNNSLDVNVELCVIKKEDNGKNEKDSLQ